MTPGKSARHRAAAHTLHSKHDSRQLTQPARAAFMARFERQVDPDAVLDPAERARRAAQAKRAFYVALGAKSGKARRSAA